MKINLQEIMFYLRIGYMRKVYMIHAVRFKIVDFVFCVEETTLLDIVASLQCVPNTDGVNC